MSDPLPPPVAVELRDSGPSQGMDAGRWLAAIVESSEDAIIGKSLDGVTTSWNSGATRVFGYRAEEAIGQPVSILDWPEEAGQLEPLLERVRQGERVDHVEMPLRHKDGRKIIVSLSLSRIYGNNGEMIGIAKIARDITERRALEESRAAEERQARAQAEQEAAAQRTQVKQEYLSSASHELRTPLHTILGFSELLADEGNGPLNEKQRKFLAHIQDDSAHLLNLINDILDLDRMEAGGLELNLESLSVRNAVSEAMDAIRPYAESTSVSLREGSDLDLHVLADPTRLRQILYNLLGNGIKFTREGGEVSVSAETKDDVVEITVSDTGTGIAPEELGRIFDKFYQTGVVRDGAREGTGLGLTISRQLVEMQGGTIWVDSELGKGSQFHFTLPRR